MAKHVINNIGGRKPLSEDEKYGTPIPVRFTKKQFIRIKRKAGEMPISTYIREGALHAIVRQPVTKSLMKEIRDLNNLGTNINTLAKLAHQYGFNSIALLLVVSSTMLTIHAKKLHWWQQVMVST